MAVWKSKRLAWDPNDGLEVKIDQNGSLGSDTSSDQALGPETRNNQSFGTLFFMKSKFWHITWLGCESYANYFLVISYAFYKEKYAKTFIIPSLRLQSLIT